MLTAARRLRRPALAFAGSFGGLRPRLRSLTVAMATILATALVLRLLSIGSRSLWVDELFTVGIASQDPRTILTVLYGEEANMALYYFLMSAWLAVVGGDASEAWIRLPSAVFGVLSLLALYQLGAEIDRPATGLLAAALGAVNAYHVVISQEARAYTLWALLATLSWLWLLRALRTGRRSTWLGYAVLTALAFYTHLFTVFVVAAQGAFVALRGRLAELRALIASGLAVVLLCLPFVPFFLANHDGSQILHVPESDPQDLVGLFRAFAGASTPALVAYVVLAAAGLLSWLPRLRAGGPRPDISPRLAPLLWLLVPTLAVFMLSYVKPMFKERYLFAAMPAFPLLVAFGLAALRPAPLAMACGLLVGTLSLAPAFAGFRVRQDENWRAAVGYLEASVRADDGLIFISKRGQLGYEYYGGWLRRTPPDRSRPDLLEPFDWQDLAASSTYYRALTSGPDRLRAFAARHPRIWLVLSHEFDAAYGGDTSASLRDWLTRRGYSARQRTFQGIRVLLYERPA